MAEDLTDHVAADGAGTETEVYNGPHSRTRVLFLMNCQGAMYTRLLNLCSPTFRDDWFVMETIQAQWIKAHHGGWLEKKIRYANVIVAQPLPSAPTEVVRPWPLMKLAQQLGKPVVMLPALHFDAVFASSVPMQWRGAADYPFEANEDAALAAAYVTGMSPAQAAAAFHQVPFMERDRLLARIEANLEEYRKREANNPGILPASDYYEREWRRQRLHFVKAHPRPHVSLHFAGLIAEGLGLTDFDPNVAGHVRGPFHHALPVKAWVRDALDLTHDGFDTSLTGPEAETCSHGDFLSLEGFATRMFAFYDQHGRDEVARLMAGFAPFRRAEEAYRKA